MKELDGVEVCSDHKLHLGSADVSELPSIWILKSDTEDAGERFGCFHFSGVDSHPAKGAFVAGGQCVLSPNDYEICLANKWGIPHPFAGYHHPVLGITIPLQTLLFRAPRSEEDLEVVWAIIRAAYRFAKDRILWIN